MNSTAPVPARRASGLRVLDDVEEPTLKGRYLLTYSDGTVLVARLTGGNLWHAPRRLTPCRWSLLQRARGARLERVQHVPARVAWSPALLIGGAR